MPWELVVGTGIGVVAGGLVSIYAGWVVTQIFVFREMKARAWSAVFFLDRTIHASADIMNVKRNLLELILVERLLDDGGHYGASRVMFSVHRNLLDEFDAVLESEAAAGGTNPGVRLWLEEHTHVALDTIDRMQASPRAILNPWPAIAEIWDARSW